MSKDKKQISSVKGLVVRSVGERRGREGYSFTSTPQFIDVQADGLTDEQIDAISSDPYLMTVEVDKAPKGAETATRRDQNGNVLPKGAYALGNATLETATREMVEEAKQGHLTTMHPSAPGGEPVSGEMHPDAVDENLNRLQTATLPEGAKRRVGRPAGSGKKPTPTAKTADTTGDNKTTATPTHPSGE